MLSWLIQDEEVKTGAAGAELNEVANNIKKEGWSRMGTN